MPGLETADGPFASNQDKEQFYFAFRGRENMDSAGMTTLFPAKAFVRTEKFDFQNGLVGDMPDMGTTLIVERFWPSWRHCVIEWLEP